jgi:hypothetical protein
MFNPTVVILAPPVEEALAALFGELGVLLALLLEAAASVDAAAVVAAAVTEVLEKLEDGEMVLVELAATRVTVLVTAAPDPEAAGEVVGPAPTLLGPPATFAVVVAAAPPQLGRKEGEYVAVPW